MLPIEPVYNTFPSLINLAFRLFAISPSITFDPATLPIFDTLKIGHAAAQCVARAIARAIYNATPSDSDKLPCWSTFYKSH